MQSSPEHIGYIVGALGGLVLALGIVAFAVVAIVKAFTQKTTGWIITASIFGAITLFLGSAFVVGFVSGFKRAMEANRGWQNDSASVTNQTIIGHRVAYNIQVPANWRIQRDKKDFDLLANQGTLFVSVIAEEADLGTPENVAKIARKNVTKVAEDVQITDSTPVDIDGHHWLQFSVTCKIQSLPFYYQYYVYAGPEGTFQIIAWTFQNLKDKASPKMDTIAKTFTFPKSAPTNGV